MREVASSLAQRRKIIDQAAKLETEKQNNMSPKQSPAKSPAKSPASPAHSARIPSPRSQAVAAGKSGRRGRGGGAATAGAGRGRKRSNDSQTSAKDNETFDARIKSIIADALLAEENKNSGKNGQVSTPTKKTSVDGKVEVSPNSKEVAQINMGARLIGRNTPPAATAAAVAAAMGSRVGQYVTQQQQHQQQQHYSHQGSNRTVNSSTPRHIPPAALSNSSPQETRTHTTPTSQQHHQPHLPHHQSHKTVTQRVTHHPATHQHLASHQHPQQQQQQHSSTHRTPPPHAHQPHPPRPQHQQQQQHLPSSSPRSSHNSQAALVSGTAQSHPAISLTTTPASASAIMESKKSVPVSLPLSTMDDGVRRILTKEQIRTTREHHGNRQILINA